GMASRDSIPIAAPSISDMMMATLLPTRFRVCDAAGVVTSDAPEQHQHQHDDQHDPQDAATIPAGAKVGSAAQRHDIATDEQDDEDDEKQGSKAHGVTPIRVRCRNARVLASS